MKKNKDIDLSKNNLIAVYGTLRPNNYNFARFNSENNCKIVKEDVRISGFKLRDLGYFPYAVRTENSSDKLTVTLLKVNERIAESIYLMERGAGYYADSVKVKGNIYTIYLYTSDQESNEDPLIKSGDYNKHCMETIPHSYRRRSIRR